MKLNKWLFAGALLSLGLTSCNKENTNIDPNQENEGRTYMTVSFRMADPQMRDNENSDYNHIGTWNGRDKINKVDIYLADVAGAISHTVVNGADIKHNPDNTVHTTKAFKTTPGQKTAYVVINANGAIETALNGKTTLADFEPAYQEAYNMIATAVANGEALDADYATMNAAGDKDIIIMSGAPGTITVADNITETQATTTDQNKVKVNVSRAAARVVLSFSSKISYTGTPWDGTGSVEVLGTVSGNQVTFGTLSDLSWTVAQYEKTSYFMQKMATPVTEGVMSPSYNYIPTSGTYSATAETHYDYSLRSEKFVIKPFSRTGNHDDEIQQIIKMNMKFITETTHKSGVIGGVESNYRRGNTPYLMVRGTFSPKQDMFADGEFAGFSAGNTLYLGLIDGKFYQNLAKAKLANPSDPADTTHDNVIEFKNGKMFYFVWVNPDKDNAAEWYNSPVLRNNIYHVNVTGFKKLGFSGNPYDPNPVDPVDPDEPTPDPDDPLNDKDTYMSVEVTVIPWGVHSTDISL